MRKWIVLIFVSMFLGVFFSSLFMLFSVSPGELVERLQNRVSPQKEIELRVQTYFNAWIQQNPKLMYAQLCQDDQERISVTQYMNEFKELPLNPSWYKIKKSIIKKNAAMVLVEMGWPAIDAHDSKENSSIDSQEQPYVLIREKGLWKISENSSWSED